MTFKAIDYSAKADHFADMAARAAYNSATALDSFAADQWADRAARYDEMADAAREMLRRAA